MREPIQEPLEQVSIDQFPFCFIQDFVAQLRIEAAGKVRWVVRKQEPEKISDIWYLSDEGGCKNTDITRFFFLVVSVFFVSMVLFHCFLSDQAISRNKYSGIL